MIWPLCLSGFAHQIFVHYKSAKSCDKIFSRTGLQNKQTKNPKEKAAYKMTEILVSKLVCDVDIYRNYLVPMQPAKSPHDLAEDSGAGMA